MSIIFASVGQTEILFKITLNAQYKCIRKIKSHNLNGSKHKTASVAVIKMALLNYAYLMTLFLCSIRYKNNKLRLLSKIPAWLVTSLSQNELLVLQKSSILLVLAWSQVRFVMHQAFMVHGHYTKYE